MELESWRSKSKTVRRYSPKMWGMSFYEKYNHIRLGRGDGRQVPIIDKQGNAKRHDHIQEKANSEKRKLGGSPRFGALRRLIPGETRSNRTGRGGLERGPTSIKKKRGIFRSKRMSTGVKLRD